jgi:diguanylate cyclase (GGDEF)-like protein
MGVLFSSLSQMQSGKDTLTSLLNRRYLPVVLKHEVTLAMEYELPMTVAIIDIDHFKEINDSWGHMVGDRAIKHVAELLSDNIRSSDYIFRYGGEEFLLVLVETGAAEALLSLNGCVKKSASWRLALALTMRFRLPPASATPSTPVIRITICCCAMPTARCTSPSAMGATA